MDPSGEEKKTYVIGDFDSAKVVSRKDKATDVIGTPSFMAPEILNSQNEIAYSFAADSKYTFLKYISSYF